LSLVGAYTIGYVQGIRSIAGTINDVVAFFASSVPNFVPQVTALVTTYLQNVTPTLSYYLPVGILMAAGGFFLIAKGDGKQKGAQAQASQEQQLPVKQQE